MWRTIAVQILRRQSPTCHWCGQARSMVSNVADALQSHKSTPDDKPRKKIPKRLTEDKKDTILHFFNNCDHVTLKKLINQKPALFKNLDPISVIQTGNPSQRFQDIEHLVKHASIDPVKLSEISKLIQVLRKSEDTSFGVRFMTPAFPVEKIPDVERVAGLNMFQNKLCWVVESRDREVTEVGSQVFEANAFYNNTALHHQQCLDMLSAVPYADVYLTMLLRPPVKLNRNPQYVISQGIMESLVISLLNLRQAGYIKRLQKRKSIGENLSNFSTDLHGNLVHSNFVDSLYEEEKASEDRNIVNSERDSNLLLKDSDALTDSSKEEMIEDLEIVYKRLFNDTSVFVVKLQAFQDFYDVTFMNELLECLPLLNLSADFNSQKGPLQGVQLSEEMVENIRVMPEKEQIARCLLMSDMFCRSLQKASAFPRAYS